MYIPKNEIFYTNIHSNIILNIFYNLESFYKSHIISRTKSFIFSYVFLYPLGCHGYNFLSDEWKISYSLAYQLDGQLLFGPSCWFFHIIHNETLPHLPQWSQQQEACHRGKRYFSIMKFINIEKNFFITILQLCCTSGFFSLLVAVLPWSVCYNRKKRSR